MIVKRVNDDCNQRRRNYLKKCGIDCLDDLTNRDVEDIYIDLHDLIPDWVSWFIVHTQYYEPVLVFIGLKAETSEHESSICIKLSKSMCSSCVYDYVFSK